jgi:hypothetical protein
MPVTLEVTGQALPLYGSLVLVDPFVEMDDDDGTGAVQPSPDAYVETTRHRIYIRAAQPSAAITVRIQLWTGPPDAPPPEDWNDSFNVSAEFPQGQLILQNISYGAVALSPGDITQVTLPAGPGRYDVRIWSRNRDDAIRRVNEIWEQTRNSPTSSGQYNSVNGLEEYLAQIWKDSHR